MKRVVVNLDQWVQTGRVQRHIGSGVEEYAAAHGLTAQVAVARLIAIGLSRSEAQARYHAGETDRRAPAPGRKAKRGRR